MENLSYYKNNIKESKIAILGCGVSGIAAAKLGKYFGADIFISENKNDLENRNHLIKNNIENFEFGGHTDKCLESDLIIKSPGIDPENDTVKKIRNKNIPIISEIEFASWFTNSKIIGVTGSNGKSTTVKIIHEILQTKYENALLGGNIGIPFSSNVQKEIENNIKNCIHIVELSSFQLENIHFFKPQISCILNLSHDHLDRYPSVDSYFNAKLNILKNIDSKSFFIYNEENSNLTKAISKKKLNYIPYGLNNKNNNFYLDNMKIINTDNKKYIDCKAIHLNGKHNYSNIIAALEICKLLKIDFNCSIENIKKILPLKHRMEVVPTSSKIKFINDSKGTNINSTVNAINTFNESIILILGGYSKGEIKYDVFLKKKLKNIKFIICYGIEGINIFNQLKGKFQCNYIKNFKKCIKYAINIAKNNDIVLLSPACSSYDQFNNFEERGEEFIKIVKKYNSKFIA